nr:hypothetical protein [Tanacetum cinerariifolium]
YINSRLLFTYFRIPGESLDEGLLPLMFYEDVIIFLEYVPRFREPDVCIETGISLVERKMIEGMRSKRKGVLIEEIMKDHDVNNAIGKEFGSETENNASTSKLEPVFEGSNDNDFGVFDSDNELPPPCASISLLEGDLETWVEDEEVEQDNDVEWQHDPYHLVDEPEEITDLFGELDQAMDELDQAIKVEDVTDLFDELH